METVKEMLLGGGWILFLVGVGLLYHHRPSTLWVIAALFLLWFSRVIGECMLDDIKWWKYLREKKDGKTSD